jgi:hypothetical protein
MTYEARRGHIEKLESLRGSKVICYITSTRPNAVGSISADAVREFLDHLLTFSRGPIDKLDLFLVSNGGDGTIPWRLIPIFREYAKEFAVLIPFSAYSAATIMALGANEIVMHRFGAMGPIDPTVTNEFNPVDPSSNRKLGISVEDVKAYVSFVKETVGIRHEEELVKTIEILASKVHPLALGNVERFISQARMIARKLLTLHTDKDKDHTLDGIIEALASKLYFHGHPINRVEARELGLKVIENPGKELERAMWDLFVDFEIEMELRQSFDPMGELFANALPGAGTPGIFNEIARIEKIIRFAMIESMEISSRFESTVRYTLLSDPQMQQIVNQTVLRQQWSQVTALPRPQRARRSQTV